MGGFFAKIVEALKVILAVLGITSAYPPVTIDSSIFVYPNLMDQRVIDVQFRCYNLINPAIQEVIQSGVDVEIVWLVRTTASNSVVFQDQYVRKISWDNGKFLVNRQYRLDLNGLTNFIIANEIIILTNASKYAGIQLDTGIDVLIRSSSAPELMSLWGNKPRILLSYTLKD